LNVFYCDCLISAMNSARVASEARKEPSTEEVTIGESVFSAPRMAIQRSRASIVTPTPRGSIASLTAQADTPEPHFP